MQRREAPGKSGLSHHNETPPIAETAETQTVTRHSGRTDAGVGEREMVSHGRRRTSGASPHAHALTPVQLRQTARCRKQTLTAKLSDSGFEEDDLDASSPGSSTAPVPPEVSPLRAEELPTWFLQYGDVGYLTQRGKEMNFQPCRSLARQPQVGHTSCYCRMDGD